MYIRGVVRIYRRGDRRHEANIKRKYRQEKRRRLVKAQRIRNDIKRLDTIIYVSSRLETETDGNIWYDAVQERATLRKNLESLQFIWREKERKRAAAIRREVLEGLIR